jgi:hypothetical protein
MTSEMMLMCAYPLRKSIWVNGQGVGVGGLLLTDEDELNEWKISFSRRIMDLMGLHGVHLLGVRLSGCFFFPA